MKSFLNQNKRLLEFYSKAAHSFGWGLLLAGIVLFLLYIFCILAASDAAGDWNLYHAVTFLFSFAILEILALCISQLLRFILDVEYKGGWILRRGHLILSACGAAIAAEAILKMSLLPNTLDPDYMGLIFGTFFIVPIAAKILILVALGVILKRVIPIIDESRTLI